MGLMKIDKLTNSQVELLETVKNEWIDFVLKGGDGLDEKTATKGIEWLYSLASLKKPVCIFVDSPLAVQQAIHIAKELLKVYTQVSDQVYTQVFDQVHTQVFDQVSDQVHTQVSDQVYTQVFDQVHTQVSDQVYTQVFDQVHTQVYTQVYTQVRTQVSDQVYTQVFDQVHTQVYTQVREYVAPTYDSLSFSSGWIANHDYFQRIGVVKSLNLDKYKEYLKSGVFYGVFLDGLVIVCRRPKAVRRDLNNLLHNEKHKAIEWRDGWGLYMLHGVNFDYKIWKKIVSQKFTMKDLTEITDVDKRAVAIQMLKPEVLLKQVGAKLIHTGIKATKLYKVEKFAEKVLGDSWEESEVKNSTEYCMLMTCPSTSRQFIEWVEPKVGKLGDADLCQANAWGIKKEDYLRIGVEA